MQDLKNDMKEIEKKLEVRFNRQNEYNEKLKASFTGLETKFVSKMSNAQYLDTDSGEQRTGGVPIN